jgi:hypothetical protein
MTKQQIENSLELCHNQPLSMILRLFDYWGPEELNDLAEHFNCEKDKTVVAMHLMMGR